MTFLIIGITVIISLVAMQSPELFHKLSFSPWLIDQKKQSWRFLSHGLVHAGWAHLAINMFVLYSFGSHVEEAYEGLFGVSKGMLFYFLLYVGGILFSTVFDYGKHKSDPYYTAVGASGAVASVLFASVIISPTSKLLIFPIPFPVPAYIFGVLYLVYSAYMGRRGQDNIGHYAHFFGAVFGVFFTILTKPELIARFGAQLGLF